MTLSTVSVECMLQWTGNGGARFLSKSCCTLWFSTGPLQHSVVLQRGPTRKLSELASGVRVVWGTFPLNKLLGRPGPQFLFASALHVVSYFHVAVRATVSTRGATFTKQQKGSIDTPVPKSAPSVNEHVHCLVGCCDACLAVL